MKNVNIENALHDLVHRTGNMLSQAPWEDKDFYAAWLAQACYYIRHSTRLLALTAANIPLDANPMHYRFLKHCAEEKGHENLPVNDMKSIDRHIADFPEFSVTKAFYQTQYYWIEHVHPHAFFGYILFLESLACDFGPSTTQQVEKIHGPKSVSFMQVHSDADVEHVRDALERVAKLPEQDRKVILENIELTHTLYTKIYQECLALAAARKQKAA